MGFFRGGDAGSKPRRSPQCSIGQFAGFGGEKISLEVERPLLLPYSKATHYPSLAAKLWKPSTRLFSVV
jgi:hypothetical protein